MPWEPERDVAETLEARVPGLVFSVPTGRNVFLGGIREANDGVVPNEAVFVERYSGGDNPSRPHDDLLTFAFVQIIVRSDRHQGYVSGRDLAQRVIDELHSNIVPGHCEIIPTTGSPLRLGRRADDQFEWSINVRVRSCREVQYTYHRITADTFVCGPDFVQKDGTQVRSVYDDAQVSIPGVASDIAYLDVPIGSSVSGTLTWSSSCTYSDREIFTATFAAAATEVATITFP